MKRRTSQIIMGSTLGLAAIAAAIDHTRHPLPEPQQIDLNETDSSSPCSLGSSPCSLGSSPCSLGSSPCSLGSSPCSLGSSPCSLGGSPCSLGSGGQHD